MLTVAFDQPPRAPLGQQTATGGEKRANRLLISTGKSIAAAFGAGGSRGRTAAGDAAPETTSNITTPTGRKRIREEAPLPGERSQPRLQVTAPLGLLPGAHFISKLRRATLHVSPRCRMRGRLVCGPWGCCLHSLRPRSKANLAYRYLCTACWTCPSGLP